MDDISDPLGDRVMKSVPPLARFPLKQSEIWHNSGEYNIKKYGNHNKSQSHNKLSEMYSFQAVKIVYDHTYYSAVNGFFADSINDCIDQC